MCLKVQNFKPYILFQFFQIAYLTPKALMSNWIGRNLRRNCLLKRVIEGKVEGMGIEEEDVNSYWMT
jgi:hypothetical protein